MKYKTIVVLLLAATANGAAPAEAQRPRVRVSFEIMDPTYQSEYNAPEIAFIEGRGAGLLARHLGAEFGFLSFDSTAAASYSLRVVLAKRDHTSVRPDDMILHAFLTGPGINPGRIHWKQFRPAADFLRKPGPPRQLLWDLGVVLNKTEVTPLMRLLQKVPIATGTNFNQATDFSQNPLGWVLPYARRDLCIHAASTLLVENNISFPGGPSRLLRYEADASGESRPVAGRVISVAKRTHPEYSLLQQAVVGKRVKVSGVYVVRYEWDPRVCSPISRPGGTE